MPLTSNVVTFSFIFVFAYGQQETENLGQLLFVQAIWRHGDRAPNRLPYPKDAHTEKSWSRGWSQLTNLGIRQMYDLGTFLKQRYGDFLGDHFNPKDVMVVSTDSDRAIVSAQAVLRGLFPAKHKDMWLEDEPWQPLPFFSHTPGRSDPLLRPTDHDCRAYDLVTKVQNDDVIQKLNKEFEDVFEFLVDVTGFRKVDFGKVSLLSNIQREVIHNMSQPSWVFQRWESHGNKTTLEIIAELRTVGRMMEFNSTEKAKFRGGLLLGDWLSRAARVSNGKQNNPRKILLYSAHDGTVSALQHAMKVDDGKMIPYAGCMIMEIYKRSDNEVVTQIIYKKDSFSSKYRVLTVPGCNSMCPVDELIEILSSQSFSNERELQQACRLDSLTGKTERKGSSHFYILLIFIKLLNIVVYDE